MNDRNRLKARIDTLSPMAVRFVARLVDSLSETPATLTTTSTWLTRHPQWIEYFGLAISAHHGTTTEPLGLTSFETVFRNACEALDWTLDAPGSATRRFVDLTLTPADGTTRRLSLKSTAAKKLAEGTAHISKLTEAAWIQDVRSARARRQRFAEGSLGHPPLLRSRPGCRARSRCWWRILGVCHAPMWTSTIKPARQS